jgi:hypothetical protein
VKVLTGVLGGTALGAATGWFLPLAFSQNPPEYAGLALLAFRPSGPASWGSPA